ncbi:stage II sporulation protein M [Okibacterium fritillariae]|uniref:Uncharacterized membrane protein SpoIIM, required for sporulation n=1 Tax=Okibacterium fritillariae TaxID=123320 RepID=A0A1T5KH46_9MICO|nr:stage II sporulation protein M [Okibacterium fritillariae]SKC63086.1 Uncharacterized membrane protein SpoIIM, required for sporulation [Okibacterium fritillariae]
MDLDAYTAAHRQEWDRLDALGAKRSFSGAEADELIEHYQAGATQLSQIASVAGSSVQGARLSVSLSRARMRFTAASSNVLSQLPRFFVVQLPAALYQLRWLTLIVALVTVVVAALWSFWVLNDPQVLANFGTDAQLQKIANDEFINYYSENPAASFAGQVWTNNAWIAAQCIAFGVTGIWVPYIILQNAQGLGTTSAVLFSQGEADTFFLYIAPHGLLELTSVFVAAAAGLRIFWAWVAPGGLPRAVSLARQARSMFTVVIGLVLSLFVSGIIEGFVTPQPWPWPVKIGIGALALAAFLAYMLVLGRRAVRAGETGDLSAFEAGAERIYAA